MRNRIIDSTGFIGLTSILNKVAAKTKKMAYVEVNAAMQSGKSIPGVEYRHSYRGVGWQIRVGGVDALEDFCRENGHVFPYKDGREKGFVRKSKKVVTGGEVISKENVDGLAELLGVISDNERDDFSVKEDLIGRYRLTPQEISLIGITGTSDDKFTYSRKDVLRGLLKSPRIVEAADKLLVDSACEILHYKIVCDSGRKY